MDRFERIKRDLKERNDGLQFCAHCVIKDADISWLIAEVERLRKIEDAVRAFETIESFELNMKRVEEMFEVLEANPRPTD